ncbi:MAG TPA: FtsX-like permease family protein [Rhodanobacter sp.]
MEIRPILSSLRRHKITALLLVLEMALTCAIVCNAVFMINQRLQRMQMSSGIAERELVEVQVATIGQVPDAKARTASDIALLRQIPGVKSATLATQLPFANSSWNTGIMLAPMQKSPTLNATTYYGEGLAEVLGTQLASGRFFNADDYRDLGTVMKDHKSAPDTVIITNALAGRLWPGENPLGKLIWLGKENSVRVVGVVKALIRPSLGNGDDTAQWTLILPLRASLDEAADYVLRTSPEQRDEVIKAAAAALHKADPHRVLLDKKTMQQLRMDFFRNDRAMAGLLVGVIVALLVVTALGIVGLGSFWVAQRRRQIGVRRALGATRRNILRYFQTENFLLATIGIALGMVLAYGINLFLMTKYELPRLPAEYFPIGAIALWLIGQLAVLGPAMRASAVPPVVATRSV